MIHYIQKTMTKMKNKPLLSKKEDIYSNHSPDLIMKNIFYSFILILLFVFTIPQTFSYSMRGGDIFLVRSNSPYIDHGYVPPEYLSVEDLIFYTCIEEEDIPIKSSVICMDDNSFADLQTVRWRDDENCYMGTYNLDYKECKKVIIQSEYIKDDELVTLQKQIKVNRLSSILDLVTKNQYSDGGWQDSVATAAGLWVLSNSKEIFDDEIVLGIEWLKLNRNNEYKCWPNDDCSVFKTAKIMAYLSLGDFNSTYRIMHDGILYLEKSQNYFLEDDSWSLDIKPYEPGNTYCLISYEKNLYNEENFTIAENEIVTYEINPVPDMDLMIICDQNFQVNLTTAEEELVFIYEGDNMSYKTPYNCWSNDHKWGECDLTTTLFAMISNISESNKELAMNYLNSELKHERTGEMSIGDENNISDTALFSYVADNDNVTSWLRFRQNNIGSWGDYDNHMDNIITTGYGLLGLLNSNYNRTDEIIEDAEKWVNARELEFILNLTADYNAWNSTEKNALAYIVLKNNARPLIKSTPPLIIIEQEKTEIELFNPTTYELNDISFEFSDNLKDLLVIEEQEYLSSYSYIRQTITKKSSDIGNIYGFLYIYNYDEELSKVPVMITNFPELEINSQKDNILVFGTSAKVNFDIIKSGHTFNCKVNWENDDISSVENIIINSNSVTLDITFDSPERIEKTYDVEFDCKSGDYSSIISMGISISRYASFPFSVNPENILINETKKDKYFIIKNNLDETLDVSIQFLKNAADFELSRSNFAIDPNNDINISIYNNVIDGFNVTETNVIEITALGQKKNVDFRAMIIAQPITEFSKIITWIIIIGIIILFIVGGYFGYKNKKLIMNFLRKGNKIDSIKIKIKKLEEKEKHTAILNMVNILRILKKDDIQIRTRLKSEGFNDDEINSALKQDEDDQDGDDGAGESEDLFRSD